MKRKIQPTKYATPEKILYEKYGSALTEVSIALAMFGPIDENTWC
jgi:hypothetical protein